MNEKTELLGMNNDEIEEYLSSIGEPKYRGRQIYKWIYQKNISSFYNMSDIPKNLRVKLDENANISIPRFLKQRVSQDGTRKFLLEMIDKKRIETVVIPQSLEKNTKYSLCISTQVGCPIGCSFCATGTSGFQRNLKSYEIVGQILSSRRELSKRLKNFNSEMITNVVYMGMGEPFLNYDEVIKSIHLLIDYKGINIGQRNITISTAGEVNGINKLAKEALQVTLAISLHASNNHLRNRLIPLNKKYPIEELFKAVDNYIKKTNRRVTFEYIMLDEINTSRTDATNLIKLVKPLLANVNLIPYNEIQGIEFKKPSESKVAQFYEWLEKGGINVVVRGERGSDIEAACGQLSSRKER
ncbi:methyltransferase [Candidatus Syntrophocurvum alkaliphilum]|uniref:Probable dual-specificity RNA methyltransferase RlmN n=1 Tax=Candidatus Syntrophocurvum alkaliphilum TaxID=2293317 RepID=A0A6I6DH31_9FIRM|nr:23S rRNA (adenine(2503)-C(2))-methyltransferase RlmN [Candidatus Syntrophocurvum alkaliphilum]QGT99613.1 methyltransferase [Candidatus Syntrophocurvum alkaliphilum]